MLTLPAITLLTMILAKFTDRTSWRATAWAASHFVAGETSGWSGGAAAAFLLPRVGKTEQAGTIFHVRSLSGQTGIAAVASSTIAAFRRFIASSWFEGRDPSLSPQSPGKRKRRHRSIRSSRRQRCALSKPGEKRHRFQARRQIVHRRGDDDFVGPHIIHEPTQLLGSRIR